MFNWLWKRIFTPDRVGYLVALATPYIQAITAEVMKNAFMEVITDEEVNKNLIIMGDAVYDRYTKKFWGSIGGMQKGLNFQTQQLNPLGNILDKDGNISLSGIIKTFAQRSLINRSQIAQIPLEQRENRPNTNNREVPSM